MKNIILKLRRFLIISLAFTGTAALAFANPPVKPELNNSSSTTAALTFNYTGPELGIEEWMSDITYWGFPYEYVASEAEGGIEGWMVNTLYWSYPSEYEASEAADGIEGWMVNTLYWSYPSEYELTGNPDGIEDWMMNPCYWDTVHKYECADNNNPAVIKSTICMNKWTKDSDRLVNGG